MRNHAPLILVGILWLFGAQQGRAQYVVCGDGKVCIADDQALAAAPPDQTLMVANLTDLVNLERCPEAPVDVSAVTPGERRVACSAASDAIQLLSRCEILLRRPLNVRIMSEVRHPFSGITIFGLLDTKQERVLITQEANVPSLVKGTPFAKLPLRDFYASLIVHEVIHGVMHQNLKRPAASHAAYEYAAYALQIESFAPHVRETFLQSFDQTAIKAGITLFSDALLFFDPYFFAASAYQHFKGSADGCAHLTGLLAGEVAFIAPPKL